MAITVVAVLLVAGGAWAAWARVVPYVVHHDYFRLRTIRVSSDETRVAPQTLAEIAGLYDDASLWDVDPSAIRSSLHDASWVRDATVTRHFPWQVSLAVTRRHAVAAAVASGKAYLVDGDGVLFHEVEQSPAPDLPYLTGWDQAEAQADRVVRLRALLRILDAASSKRIDVSELHMDDGGAVWLYANGIKASVRLGDESRAAVGLDRLAIALAELGPLADRARVIDTDYRDRIVIRGADDKLPAMLAAQSEKAGATQNEKGGAPEASAETAPGPRASGTRTHASSPASASSRQATASAAPKSHDDPEAHRHG